MKKVFFATSNKNKYLEAKAILRSFNIEVEWLKGDYPEIQAESLEEIASFTAKWVAEKTKKAVFVEDAGLFIQVLNGFPGPYSSYVYKTLGNHGILKLLEGETNREAFFISVIAYCEPTSKPAIFIGKVNGTIAYEIRGNKGWGFDPIFIPTEGEGKTYAEMGPKNKNKISHRRKSLEKFGAWLSKYYEKE
ncbi:MAG: XTP/dITP diphosphatase [Candidatus Baldrarchaeia archaeon]